MKLFFINIIHIIPLEMDIGTVKNIMATVTNTS